MDTKEIQYEELDTLLISFRNATEEKKKRMLHLKIVEKAMDLVKRIANTIALQSGIANEDLIQVGSLGLIKAIEFYRLDMNTKFKTYATYFIKGEIKHYLRDKASIIKAPRELQELLFKINTARKKLNETGMEDPSPEQIAEYLDIPIAKINEVIEIERCKSTLSLDQSFMQDDEDTSLLDKIPANDYREFMNSYENKIMLATTIKKLPQELREIIELSYYQDLNQREISEKMNMSQMQVSRRLKKALNRMYELINKNNGD
ncbi:sigma-70 family RNA polymerase sigma factor [bacterium]|nr:sigma-70 family RNA polymerase sigma factor [bacterium]